MMESVFVFCVFLTSQHFWLANYFWIAHFIDFGEIMYLLALPSPVKSKGVSVIDLLQDINYLIYLHNLESRQCLTHGRHFL